MGRGSKYRRTYKQQRFIDNIKAYSVTIIILIILTILLGILYRANIKLLEKKKPTKQIKINNITRSKAYARGMEMINYVWNFDSNINGVKDNDKVELPQYLKDKESVTVNGIPYCWGGYLALDISDKAGVKSFQDAIKKGYTAGNVICKGYYKNLTAGLDCSGFVSAVFKMPYKSDTENMYKYFDEIDIKSIKPMDIFNCSNKHVFIYLRETADKKGVITMEATVSDDLKNSGKTNIYYRSWASIKNGVDGKAYVPMRYKGIIDDTVALFNDNNEYNNEAKSATNLKLNNEEIGYIDYASDEDYYMLKVEEEGQYELILHKLPKECKITVMDGAENEITQIKEAGSYIFKFIKGTYYIRFSGINLDYNKRENYAHSINKIK